MDYNNNNNNSNKAALPRVLLWRQHASGSLFAQPTSSSACLICWPAADLAS